MKKKTPELSQRYLAALRAHLSTRRPSGAAVARGLGRDVMTSGFDTLDLARIPGAIRMEVHDNGKSFQVPQTLSAKTNQRLGLVGMRERVEMVGGTLLLESVPGQGTTVRAEIPFGPRGAA